MKAHRHNCVRIAAAALVSTLAAGCVASSGQRHDTIRIGVLADCQTPQLPLYAPDLAGAELPLLERGGRLRGPSPLAGVAGASVAGKRVELAFGCSGGSAGSSPTSAFLAEARRLVENEHVDVLVAAESADPPMGNILADYARLRPHTTFVYVQAPAPAITLRDPPHNLFTLGLNPEQWMAGLGAYAYRTLGWRRAISIELGPTWISSWLESAGFMAEFCALGGTVVKRVGVPFAGQTTNVDLNQYGSMLAQIPRHGVDGFVIGSDSASLLALAQRDPRLRGSLARKVVFFVLGLDPTILRPVARRLVGAVVGDPIAGGFSTGAAYDRYAAELHRAFPEVPVLFAGPSLAFSSDVEAVLETLDAVHGDLSDGEQRFMSALAKVRVDVAGPSMRLDAHRAAIGPTFLHKLLLDPNGNLVAGPTFKRIDNVDQTFGGYFTASTPPASETSPSCHRAKPPVWASGP